MIFYKWSLATAPAVYLGAAVAAIVAGSYIAYQVRVFVFRLSIMEAHLAYSQDPVDQHLPR